MVVNKIFKNVDGAYVVNALNVGDNVQVLFVEGSHCPYLHVNLERTKTGYNVHLAPFDSGCVQSCISTLEIGISKEGNRATIKPSKNIKLKVESQI